MRSCELYSSALTNQRLMQRAHPLLLSSLLLSLPHATPKIIRAGLIEGYKEEWKFVEKFAFAAATPDDPGTIRLVAWTFMPGQKLLIYENDAWFDAYKQNPQTCEERAALAWTNSSIAKGTFCMPLPAPVDPRTCDS